jgi:hypothetical protein
MKTLHLVTVSTALLLASCGGGGDLFGDGSTGSGTSITSANAVAVAKVAYGSALNSADLAGVGGSVGITATTPGSMAKPSPQQQISGFLVDVLQKIPFGPDVFPCAVSGSLTMSGDIADPLTLTLGDTFTVDADACNDGFGETLDGLMTMTVSEFTGDLLLGTYLLGMNATLDALQVTTANDVVSSTGDTSIALDTTNTPSVSASVSGNSMVTSSNASTETLSNYSTAQTVDAGQAQSPFTLISSGSVDSSLLNGTVTYSTSVQFQGFDIDYPHTGELLVTGTNSSARLVAIDNVDVRIDLDNDGNGSVDEMINTTWAALTN